MVVGRFASFLVILRLDRAIRSKRRAAKDGPVKPDHDGKERVASLNLIGKRPKDRMTRVGDRTA